ncbi:MAG: hypothetical protein ACI4T9_05695, partial [Prevotella sp.]
EAGHAASAKELDGGSSVWNTIRTWISNAGEALKDVFLRKDQDDETTHKLTMGEAHVKGDTTIEGALEVYGDSSLEGDAVVSKTMTANDAVVKGNTQTKTLTVTDSAKTKGINNEGTVITKDLVVTGLAHFFQLIIDKVKAAGGAVFFTPADGFDVDYVKSVNGGYKLYWRCQDGAGKQRDNMWRVNDQALCKSFNRATVGTAYSASNKYYWALVTSVSTTSSPETVEGVGACHWIVISTTTCAGTVNPEVGDSIVMCGYRGTDDAARQSAIYISAYTSMDSGLSAPLLAQYRGINDFDLASHRKSYFDASKARFVGDFETSDGVELLSMIQQKVGSITLSVDRAAGKGNMLSGGKLNLSVKKSNVWNSDYITVEKGKTYTLTANLYKAANSDHQLSVYFANEDHSNKKRLVSTMSTSSSEIMRMTYAATATEKMRVEIYEQSFSYGALDDNECEGVTVNWVRVDEGDWTTEPNVKTSYEESVDDKINDAKSEIKVTTDGIQQTVTEHGDVMSALGMTKDGISMTGKTFTFTGTDGTQYLVMNSTGATFSGKVSAATIEGSTITGGTISGTTVNGITGTFTQLFAKGANGDCGWKLDSSSKYIWQYGSMAALGNVYDANLSVRHVLSVNTEMYWIVDGNKVYFPKEDCQDYDDYTNESHFHHFTLDTDAVNSSWYLLPICGMVSGSSSVFSSSDGSYPSFAYPRTIFFTKNCGGKYYLLVHQSDGSFRAVPPGRHIALFVADDNVGGSNLVRVALNNGWQTLSGGQACNCVMVPQKVVSPTPATVIKAYGLTDVSTGWLWTSDRYDNNWRS